VRCVASTAVNPQVGLMGFKNLSLFLELFVFDPNILNIHMPLKTEESLVLAINSEPAEERNSSTAFYIK